MYLIRTTDVKNYGDTPEHEKIHVKVTVNHAYHKVILPSRITGIREEMGRWRNFRPLHNWFLDNMEEDGTVYDEVLQDLKTLLEETLELLKQGRIHPPHEEACKLLNANELHITEITYTLGVVNTVLEENKLAWDNNVSFDITYEYDY